MRQDPAVDGEEAENTGGDQEQLPFPKKRKGNRGNGNYGFMPSNMAQSGFGGFLGDDFMGVGGGLMNVGYIGNYRGRQMWPPRRTMEDRHVLDKHKSIYPDGVELNHILQTVDKVERGLKKISDKFFEDGDGSEREVTGVARVGDLAKSLLLKGDSQVDLVVMCCKKPTASLLENISKSLKTEFQPKTGVKSENCDGEPAKEEPLEIVDNPVESGFVVKSGQCSVRVTLTSTLLRSNNENTNGKEYTTKSEDKGVVKTIDEVNTPKIEEDECKDIEKEEEPADLLPVEPGLMGLAELRRAKWFSAMAAPLPSCVEALRIMKDKARRDSAWAKLEDWGLELLVERALFSAGYSLSPSKSLMRIVELVASGVLLPEGPGVKDPCEREDIDALDHLTVQDREDVTRQAQTDIRNFHYRKIHQFLDMERILTRLEMEEKKKVDNNEHEADINGAID